MPTETFTGDDEWDVPDGITRVHILTRGGSNGSADPGVVEGFHDVSPGETLYIRRTAGGTSPEEENRDVTAQGDDGGDAMDVRQDGSGESDIIALGAGAGGDGDTSRNTGSGDIASGNGGDGGPDPQDGEDADADGAFAEGGTADAMGGLEGGDGQSGSSYYNDNALAVASSGGGGAGYNGGEGGEADDPDPGDDIDDIAAAAAGGGGGKNRAQLDTVERDETTTESDPVVEIEYPDTVEQPTAERAFGMSAVALEWDDIAGEDGYRVLGSDSSGSDASDYTELDTVGAGTTSYTDDTPDFDDTRYYRIEATFDDFDPTLSDEESITVEQSPSSLTAEAGDRGEADLDWPAVDAADEYIVYRSDVDSGDKSDYDERETTSDTEYTETGLDDGERWYYVITADVDGSETTGSESGEVITILPAPSDLDHPETGDESAEYEWTATHNNGETRVEYREADADEWETYSTVDRETESETVDGLLNGEEYESRVVAQTDHAETEDES